MAYRTGVPALPTAQPIGLRLPAVYLDDEFTQRFTEAFDDVLAPVLATLDSFTAYLDPALAPDDFLEWLAGWVALSVDEGWTEAQRRVLVAYAVDLHRWRGTRRGLTAHVRMLTGGDVEVLDSGVSAWSDRPGAEVPGTGPPQAVVRVRVADPSTVDAGRLRAAVVDAVPAHVAVTVEVLPTGPPAGAG